MQSSLAAALAQRRSISPLCPLHTTDSGSICIDDFDAASKLLRKLNTGQPRFLYQAQDICIEAEWNQIKNHLVLRRVSGDSTQYNSICQQLISNIL
jgi:hypothetical protein